MEDGIFRCHGYLRFLSAISLAQRTLANVIRFRRREEIVLSDGFHNSRQIRQVCITAAPILAIKVLRETESIAVIGGHVQCSSDLGILDHDSENSMDLVYRFLGLVSTTSSFFRKFAALWLRLWLLLSAWGRSKESEVIGFVVSIDKILPLSHNLADKFRCQ